LPDRIIRESICTSETIEKLTWYEEVFWHRLVVNCDDYGRFDARPAILKSRLFPLKVNITDKTISDALNKLSTVGLIATYVCDGKPYLQLVTWEKYQRIRAKRSRFPAPDGTCCQLTSDDGTCPRNPIQSESISESISESKRDAPARQKYGEYGWVRLSDEEHAHLLKDLKQAELDRCIKHVDESAQSTGNKNGWKDWNLTIRKCNRDGWGIRPVQKKGYTAPKKEPSAEDQIKEFERLVKFRDELRALSDDEVP
jgi:hypothetical protein